MDLRKVHTPPRSPTNNYADSPAAAAFGTLLFHDAGLSGCGTISCAGCHLAPSLTTAAPMAMGCGGMTARNVPTLLNVGFGDWFGWDGRKDSIWSQPMFPLLNPVEMAATPQGAQAYIVANYATQYANVFGVTPTLDDPTDLVLANFGKALEAYERTFIQVDAPFDDHLDAFVAAVGAGTATSDPSYLGFKTFVRKGQAIIYVTRGPR